MTNDNKKDSNRGLASADEETRERVKAAYPGISLLGNRSLLHLARCKRLLLMAQVRDFPLGPRRGHGPGDVGIPDGCAIEGVRSAVTGCIDGIVVMPDVSV